MLRFAHLPEILIIKIQRNGGRNETGPDGADNRAKVHFCGSMSLSVRGVDNWYDLYTIAYYENSHYTSSWYNSD